IIKNYALLREIHEEFKNLLDSYNFNKSEFELIDKREINKIATNISKITKKLFNTNMKLKFIEADPKGRDKFRVDSVASTMIRPEQIRNTVDGIAKIVIEEKNGIYYSKPREIEVFMELSSLRYFLEMKKNSNKVAFSNFNERVCTSVLLHEIGHNLFLPIEIKVITQGKEPAFELKYKDSKPVQFQYTKDIEADTDRNLKLAGPMIISMTIMVAILTSLTGVASITGITSIFSFFKLGSMDNKRVKKMNYNLSERSANQLPALYGYATENIVLYDMIYAATNKKMEKTKNNVFSKIFRGLMYPSRLFIRNYKDYTADSIDNTIKTLKFEINNPN